MSDETRIRMVARAVLVQVDALVDEGVVGSALDVLVDAAEALAVSPYARHRGDPFPHLCALRDVLEQTSGRTAQGLVATLDDLIPRTVRLPVGARG